MRKKRIWKALIALVLIASLLCGSALAASMGAKVFSSTMTVYNSKSGSRVGALRRGTSVTVTGVSGSWARISYKGRTGYVKVKDLIFNTRLNAVSTKSSSIRFMTKDSYRKGAYYTGTLAAGVPLKLAGINGSYYLFFNEAGTVMGYVKKSAVRRAS